MAAKHLAAHTLSSKLLARSRSRAGCAQLWPWLGQANISSININIIILLLLTVQCSLLWQPVSTGDPEAKRLYDDLLSRYNRLIRPVMNYTDTLTVNLGLKLAQIVDVNLKNQIMTTNIWVEQVWFDYRFKWNPSEYGGVETLNVPAEQIWLPDIVLFNNADGNYEVTLITKASLFHTGMVVWNPPALYKSSCQIDVEFFPFDEQSCKMQFGSWTYDGIQVDLQHKQQSTGSNIVPMGINLREFIVSVEWDILDVPAIRNEEYYPGSQIPYTDITFNITMRRKTLFYTVNLIIPCVGITFLTVLVFYLPSDSGEKVSLCISILVSLTVFFLLLAEIIPPSSLAVPLLGKYLLFTMILVTLSIIVTVGVLNVHFRSPATHVMSPWVRRVFIHIMPRLLLIRRPQYVPGEGFPPETFKYPGEVDGLASVDAATAAASGDNQDVFAEAKHEPFARYSSTGHRSDDIFGHSYDEGSSSRQRKYSPEVEKAIQDVQFIAQHMRDADRDTNIVEDWKFVAMVLDRLFLWIFMIACVVGTCGIILQAPALYDDRQALDMKFSDIRRNPKGMGAS